MHLTSSPLGFVCVFHLYAGASVAVAVVEHSQRWLVSRRQFFEYMSRHPHYQNAHTFFPK